MWIRDEAKREGSQKWSWVGNGPKKMPDALTLPHGRGHRLYCTVTNEHLAENPPPPGPATALHSSSGVHEPLRNLPLCLVVGRMTNLTNYWTTIDSLMHKLKATVGVGQPKLFKTCINHPQTKKGVSHLLQIGRGDAQA